MVYGQSYGKRPAVSMNAMVATSQPRATQAGLRILEQGGSAADAAVAASAVLCVTEPMSTSVAGDCFAIVARGHNFEGLDAAGPAPRQAPADAPIEEAGPTSVTVPGAVRGWAALNERYGKLGFDACLSDAIEAAEGGFAVAPMCAYYWNMAERAPRELGPPPTVGDIVRLPELGASLRSIADGGPDAFYRGTIGEAIVSASWLEEDDLRDYAARWVEPLRLTYHGVEVLELPPPNQGVVALEALGLFERAEPTLPSLVECTRLALEDGLERVRDGADVSDLISSQYLERRRNDAAVPVGEPGGGTVYLCVIDDDGLAVSFIQSCYQPFGSGIVAPGTGIPLQNRGACFAVNGAIEPGRRPYHTIIPGMLARDGEIIGPFGIMGAFIQAQAHAQFVHNVVDNGLDPQAALDEPRFRIDGQQLLLEPPLWDRASELAASPLELVKETEVAGFGGGQAIFRERDVLVGGSDSRKDGYAAGI